jgi:anti-sigma regulatory factor (Ser/Thr protein kinase)
MQHRGKDAGGEGYVPSNLEKGEIMMTEIVELKFPALPESLSCLSVGTVAIGGLIPLSIDKIEELRQAVLEACSIIAREAYTSGVSEDRTVSITFRLDPSSRVEVEIRDEIDAFDPQPSENRTDRSLSIMIIKALMKDVKLANITSGGSRLTMSKYIFSDGVITEH